MKAYFIFVALLAAAYPAYVLFFHSHDLNFLNAKEVIRIVLAIYFVILGMKFDRKNFASNVKDSKIIPLLLGIGFAFLTLVTVYGAYNPPVGMGSLFYLLTGAGAVICLVLLILSPFFVTLAAGIPKLNNRKTKSNPKIGLVLLALFYCFVPYPFEKFAELYPPGYKVFLPFKDGETKFSKNWTGESEWIHKEKGKNLFYEAMTARLSANGKNKIMPTFVPSKAHAKTYNKLFSSRVKNNDRIILIKIGNQNTLVRTVARKLARKHKVITAISDSGVMALYVQKILFVGKIDQVKEFKLRGVQDIESMRFVPAIGLVAIVKTSDGRLLRHLVPPGQKPVFRDQVVNKEVRSIATPPNGDKIVLLMRRSFQVFYPKSAVSYSLDCLHKSFDKSLSKVMCTKSDEETLEFLSIADRKVIWRKKSDPLRKYLSYSPRKYGVRGFLSEDGKFFTQHEAQDNRYTLWSVQGPKKIKKLRNRSLALQFRDSVVDL